MNKSHKKKLNKNVLKFSEHIFQDMPFYQSFVSIFQMPRKDKDVCLCIETFTEMTFF